MKPSLTASSVVLSYQVDVAVLCCAYLNVAVLCCAYLKEPTFYKHHLSQESWNFTEEKLYGEETEVKNMSVA